MKCWWCTCNTPPFKNMTGYATLWGGIPSTQHFYGLCFYFFFAATVPYYNVITYISYWLGDITVILRGTANPIKRSRATWFKMHYIIHYKVQHSMSTHHGMKEKMILHTQWCLRSTFIKLYWSKDGKNINKQPPIVNRYIISSVNVP